MNPQSKLLLVQWLARIESVWRPIRQSWDAADAIQAAREAVSQPGGGSVAQRKSSERVRSELRKLGLVDGLQLLPAGRRLARRWTWPYERSQLIEALARIKRLATERHCRSYEFVPESLIAGEWSQDAFVGLQSMLLPSLADGIVESACTIQGHAFYRISDVVSPDDVPEVVAAISVDDAIDDLDTAMCDAYVAEFKRKWHEVLEDDSRYQDIGEIPIPLGLELNSRRSEKNFRGITPLFPPRTAAKESQGG